MRTLLTALTALMLFATPVVAGDYVDAWDAYNAGDYQKAFRLWKPFAEQEDAYAQAMIGLMYDKGRGVPEDHAKAVHWWRKAAEQGHADAQFVLGVRYTLGKGTPQDHVKAVHWYRKAAEQGHAKGQAALAGAKQLACETDDGQQAADLWIDIENGLFELGVQSYTITNITTRYIIALSSHLNLGGGKVLKEDVGSFSTRTKPNVANAARTVNAKV